jgi:tetratricopeptide (TPR) repeat protein
LAIADELNHRHQQADVLNEIGNALRGLNRHAEAIESHNAALTLAHDLADQAQIGYAHDGIARALTVSGRTDLAGDHYQQALHIYTSLAMPEAAEIQAEFDVRSLS